MTPHTRSAIHEMPVVIEEVIFYADGQDIHDAPSFTKYISALHFATTTMATVRRFIYPLCR